MSQQPEPNEFADMLEELFAGDPGADLLPTQFTEIAWEKGEVHKAIKRMKVQKSADECGLLAEILKHVPDSFIDTLVGQFNDLMRTGQVPTDRRKTSFKMLPKTIRAKVPSEYRPIATIRLFYKLFFFFSRSFFLAEGLFWMTVLLGSLQAAPFLYRRLRMCMKGWAKSKPQLLRGGLGDG